MNLSTSLNSNVAVSSLQNGGYFIYRLTVIRLGLGLGLAKDEILQNAVGNWRLIIRIKYDGYVVRYWRLFR